MRWRSAPWARSTLTIDVKQNLRKAPREGRNIFDVFMVREKESCQSQAGADRKSQEEEAWKESRGIEVEDKRKRCVAFEDACKRMLKYLEDTEDLKVGFSQ